MSPTLSAHTTTITPRTIHTAKRTASQAHRGSVPRTVVGSPPASVTVTATPLRRRTNVRSQPSYAAAGPRYLDGQWDAAGATIAPAGVGRASGLNPIVEKTTARIRTASTMNAAATAAARWIAISSPSADLPAVSVG